MAETILSLKINAKLSNEQLELFTEKLSEFQKETGLDVALISMSEVARRVEARTSNEEKAALPLQSVNVSFDFAKYLTKNYTYYDNTNEGDIYKNIATKISYNEREIIQKWNELNSR